MHSLQGTTASSGVLMLHGERREVTGSATIRPNGAGYRVEATFPVRISEFEIPDPTYLGVGVKNEVQVRVNFTVAPATTSARRSASCDEVSETGSPRSSGSRSAVRPGHGGIGRGHPKYDSTRLPRLSVLSPDAARRRSPHQLR